jgi:hypothetical protein
MSPALWLRFNYRTSILAMERCNLVHRSASVGLILFPGRSTLVARNNVRRVLIMDEAIYDG